MLKLKFLVLLPLLLPFQQGYAQNLIETFQLALENDPGYRSAYLKQFSAEEIRSQSIAQMLPNLSIDGNASRDRLNNQRLTFQTGEGRKKTQEFWSTGLSLKLAQPVFHWDHWIQLSQSENSIAQAEAEYQAEYQLLMVDTIQAYFNVLAAQDNLAFAIMEKNSIQRQLDQAQQRFEVGLIAITDVYEAQAGYDTARADEIEAANFIDDEKEVLREIIGENEADLNLLGEIELKVPAPADISEWAKVANTNNFSIVAQLNETEVARKNVERQRSGHMPTVDIIANYDLLDTTSSFGLRGNTQSLGLQLNVPLFSGGAVNSRTRQAEYDFESAKEDLTKVKRAVTREIKDSYRGVLTNISRVRAFKAAVTSSISSLESTEAGFEVGTRTMVDVLAEQRNLFRAKRDHAKSRYDYLTTGIRLKGAAGSLSEVDLQQINQNLTKLLSSTEMSDPSWPSEDR